LYGGTGAEFLAKIAAELERALGRRTANGEPGKTDSRVLGQGDGWHVADVVCTCGPRDRRFQELHSHVTIAIVVAGTFQYRGSVKSSGVGQELMSPGALLLGNTGQSFECGHEHGLGDRCLSFRYAPEYFERLAADAGISRGPRNFRILRIPPLPDLSRTIARACAAVVNGASTAWEEIGAQLAARAVLLTNDHSPATSNAPPSAMSRVTRAIRAMEAHAHSELPLGSLAREAGLSPYHFLRTFQQLTGVTPHQYLRRLRLREAVVRLASGREKVLDVALDCGFGDVSNFNRAFRAEFGASPRTYRSQTLAALSK
jgi:AraC-like DNA-binding protein